MSHEVINDWIEKAKSAGSTVPTSGIQIIRREEPFKGNVILEIADKIRPWLAKMFEGVRDENNMLLQPARVHGIALNVAQSIVKEQEEQRKKASA